MQHDRATSGASAWKRGPDASELSPLPLVYCPECGMPAWVEWRDPVGAGAGLSKVRCFARHWFLMPEDGLTAA